MSYEEFRESLHDVAFTLATPFSESGEEILHEKLVENVQTLQSSGANLFIPCGNTGEYYSLSHDERIAIVETVVNATDDDATVVAGAGGSTKTTLDLIESYADAGADGIMVMSLAHTYIHNEGAADYYRRIADATDLPVMLYKRGPSLSDEAICELSTIDNVVAVKYAVNDVASFSQIIEAAPGEIEWINGIAERFALSYAIEGADGFTTGIGNALPEPVLALSDALANEDWERAREIRDVVRPLEDLRAEPGVNNDLGSANNVPTVKHCMDLAGMYAGPIREPLVELSDTDSERATSYFDAVQDLDISPAPTAD